MGKKTEYIHIRADAELKAAIMEAAQRDIRTEADEARYLLMKALGLLAEEKPAPYQTRGHPQQKKKGNDHS